MNKKIKEYSKNKGNLQVVEDTSLNKNKPSLAVGTVNVFTQEHKVLGRPKKIRTISDIVLIILVALGLFLGTSYLINNYRIGKNVVLEARVVNEVITSGKLETFELEYSNKNRTENIEDVNITVTLPEGFVLKNVVPDNIFDEHTNTFNLGTLNSGANGIVKITGLVWGEINTQQILRASLNYKCQGLPKTSPYSLIYLIEESVLDLELSFPQEVYQNVSFSGKAVLKNNSDQALEDIELLFNDLMIQSGSSSAEIKTGNNLIYLDNLGINEEVTIDINAVVNNNEGKLNLPVNVLVNKLKQAEAEHNLVVKIPNFKISASTDKKFMTAGEKVNFKLNYTNQEDSEITNVSFNVEASNDFIIKSLKLNNTNKFIQQGNNIIVQNDLNSDESGQINLDLVFNKKTTGINQEAFLIITVNYEINGDSIQYPINSQRVKLLSNLNVKSEGYYYSPQGDQLGTGPIPPMVDIPTNYWIFWEVDNFGNDLSSFSLTADLPNGLAWTNNKSVLAGNVQYGEISRRVIWTLDNISSQGGEYRAKFEVSLIPEEKDIGDILNLLENIKFSVSDNFCHTEISGNKSNIDTNLKDDNLVSGKGRVQALEY